MSVSKSEGALQGDIVAALTKAGYWPCRVQSGIVRVKGGSFMRLAPAGTPDLLLVGPARVAGSWLEVKLPGEEPNEKQIAWHARAAKEGVRVAVVNSVEQALLVVKEWSA